MELLERSEQTTNDPDVILSEDTEGAKPKIRYHIVGAFDRHNYGDILFPLVHNEFIRRHSEPGTDVFFYAITQSDMRNIGGFETESVKALLNKPLTENDTIVLCGGDILSADWLLMVGHVRSRVFLKLSRIARRLLGVTRTNDLVRWALSQPHAFPYVISQADTSAKIFYTAVGGAGFQGGNANDHLKRVAHLLRHVNAVSVRDQHVKTLLAGEGISARLIPDTALIMSDYYTPRDLAQRLWKAKIQTAGAFDYEKYYSVQGAKRLLENKIELIAKELQQIYQLSGLAPMLVPIGRAPDHEDHIPLMQLFQRLKALEVPCAFQDSEHVLDIMASLAFAKAYIGTSLHGAITTYAFGHKACALFPEQVKKLNDFLLTWMKPGDYEAFNDSAFAERFVNLLSSGDQISDIDGLHANKQQVNEILHAYVEVS